MMSKPTGCDNEALGHGGPRPLATIAALAPHNGWNYMARLRQLGSGSSLQHKWPAQSKLLTHQTRKKMPKPAFEPSSSSIRRSLI